MADAEEKKKYKFLIVSYEGVGSDIAYQLKKEGNDVKFFIQLNECKDIVDGIIEKVDDWEREKSWADIIIFDDTGFGFRQNELRSQGFKVIGGSDLGDKLELDRKFASVFFKKMDVKVPETFEFDSFLSAKRFLKEQNKRFVIKFEGVAGDEKSLLYISQMPDNSDLIEILDHYSKKWNDAWGQPQFVLQEVVDGVETAITGWFNGEKFLMPVFVNFENKRFMNGEVGPMTGEMGEHAFFTFDKLKLFKKTLKMIEEDLRKDGYVGCIDVNCIVNKDGIWPLEFTSRFGYPTISLQFEALRENIRITDLFVGLVDKSLDLMPTYNGYEVGILVTVPTFPYEEGYERRGKGLPVIVIDKSVEEHFHPGELKLDNGMWTTCGSVGWAFIITGRGETIFDAKTEAYSNLKKIIVPNPMYRTDISDRWIEDYPRLHRWGFV